VPEVGAWTAAEIQPSAPRSLALEHALAGLTSGLRRAADALVQRHDQADGSGAIAIGACTDCVLLVCGLTPPLNLKSCSIRGLGRVRRVCAS
jgi:hypothetical protein